MATPLVNLVAIPKMTTRSPGRTKGRQSAPNKSDPDGNDEQYEMREVRQGEPGPARAAEPEREAAVGGGAEGPEAAANGGGESDKEPEEQERDGAGQNGQNAGEEHEPEFVRLCSSIETASQSLPECCRCCRKKHDVPRYFMMACLLLTQFSQMVTAGSICPGDIRFFWALLGVVIACAVIVVLIFAIHWIIPCLEEKGYSEHVSWLNDSFHKLLIVLCALNVATVIIVCTDALDLSS